MQKYANSVQDPLGNAIGLAAVTVYTDAGHTTLATLYSDNGTPPSVTANPVATNSLGEFSFYAADGRYYIVVSKTGITAQSLDDVILFDSTASTSAASIFVTQSGIAPTTRTVQDKLREIISVTDYGVGTSKTAAQNATSLQSLLDNIFTAGTLTGNRVLFWPGGDYSISGIAGANSLSNLIFRGEGKYTTRINWGGSAGVPMFKFTNARWLGFESLAIKNETANQPTYGVQFDRATGQVGSGQPTGCFMRDVFLGGGSSGSFDKAVAFTASSDSGNDLGHFENVDILNCATGYSFDHSNSLLHRIFGGSVSNCTTAAFNTYQGDGTTCGGTFSAFSVVTSGNGTILRLGPALNHTITLTAHQSEADSAYITTPSSISGNPLRVAIFGGTFKESGSPNLTFDAASGFLHIDGAYISAIGTLSIPTNGPRVLVQGGFVQPGTISYNSWVRFTDVQSAAGAPTYTNVGSGTLILDHSDGTSRIDTQPVVTSGTAISVDARSIQQFTLTYGSGTNLATLTNGYVGQMVTLIATNGNCTLVHGTGADAMRLKGAANVTLASAQTVTLKRLDSTFTGCWIEIGRNF